MAQDLTLPADDGFVNVRVGAIIVKDGKLLMVSSRDFDYSYSVGGRIRFGESAEQAIRREVREETGRDLEIDRLGFIHEDFFLCDSPSKRGKPIYEIAFYFYMKTPEDFEPVSGSVTEEGCEERLEWLPVDSPKKLYPTFIRSAAAHPSRELRHIVTDERTITDH